MSSRVLLVAALLGLAARGAAAQGESEIRRIIDRVKPALVQIYVVSADYREGREVKGESAGSGTIISEEGHVLSNHHVAREARSLVVILSDREELHADLVGTDPLSDLAVLKIRTPDGRKFPFARFGDSDRLRVGETVLAMGSPRALSQSVTKGIVSNTRMVMPRMMWPYNRLTLDGEDVGSIVRWIAHDAQIFPGNSGGPLFNLRGEIVGVNEIGYGLSGAIPGNLARDVARQLVEKGYVSRAWTGMMIQPVLQKRGESKDGALVSGTVPGSPAALAGVQSGDILLKLAGEAVSVRLPEDLPVFNNIVASLPIGKPADLVLQRGTSTVTVAVTPIEREQIERNQREMAAWGLTARDISSIMARELKLDSADGAFITSIRPGGPAGTAKPAIYPGDILLSVNGLAVTNVAELREWTEKLVHGRSNAVDVVVEFRREQELLATVVTLARPEEEDSGAEVRKAWLPVGTQVLTRELAKAMGRPTQGGVRITQVYSNTTAAAAGLRVGDVILKVDDVPVEAFQPEDEDVFDVQIREYEIGAKPELTVIRGGQSITVAVQLARSPKLERELKVFHDERFEFSVREIDFLDRARESWSEKQAGLLVTDVKPGGWAALARLAVRDLLVAVDGEPVPDIASLKRKLGAIEAARPELVVLTVQRGIYPMFLGLEPIWD